MLEKLLPLIKKYEELKEKMMSSDIASDPQEMIKISKEMSALEESYQLSIQYKKYTEQLEQAKEMLASETDTEMISMAKEEIEEAKEQIADLEQKLKIALLPKDPNDDKNIYLEIRPAAGGDEAWLFATQLLKMYLWYAVKKWRKTEIIEEQMSDIGGVKSVTVKMSGNQVYSVMKFESGVHRVQRIPDTESQWRVHTSTVTVAIMPEVEDVDIKVDRKDIVIDTFAASSSGGQNANKNQTGVRFHHIPSWLIVTIWDSKSQLQNKEKAFSVLKSRLYQLELDKKQATEKAIRWDQIGTGDRSEKIRTYNFPQDRVTDHRIHESRSNLPSIMMGNIEEILQKLIIVNQTRLLEKQMSWEK